MDMYVHYTALPPEMSLEDVVDQLNQALDDGGFVNGGSVLERGGRIDMDLEEEKINPKLAQSAVKAYLQRVHFPEDTRIELGGMLIGIYE